MIWHPKQGQRVELRYNRRLRGDPHFAALHGSRGVVICAGSGRGPVNAAVQLRDGRTLVVPRGNLADPAAAAQNQVPPA